RVGRPGELVDPAVELRQHIANLFGLAIVENQAEAVAFVSGSGLGTPCDVATVGRVAGRVVPARRGRDLHWFRVGVVKTQGEDVDVGADGGIGDGLFFKCDFLPVRRNVVLPWRS